jgi:hypothetical protein
MFTGYKRSPNSTYSQYNKICLKLGLYEYNNIWLKLKLFFSCSGNLLQADRGAGAGAGAGTVPLPAARAAV